MMLIPCPHCGPRDETEFSYGGQAHVARPENPDALDDEAWARYLFYRENTKGLFAERWVHSVGCRRWFHAVRNTVTYEISSTEPIGPRVPAGRPAETTTSEGGHA